MLGNTDRCYINLALIYTVAADNEHCIATIIMWLSSVDASWAKYFKSLNLTTCSIAMLRESYLSNFYYGVIKLHHCVPLEREVYEYFKQPHAAWKAHY